jgi:hypothetical protein
MAWGGPREPECKLSRRYWSAPRSVQIFALSKPLIADAIQSSACKMQIVSIYDTFPDPKPAVRRPLRQNQENFSGT